MALDQVVMKEDIFQCCDLEHRLKTLQTDYAALQTSNEQLEEDKLAREKEVQAMTDDLEIIKDKLKKSEDEIQSLKEVKESLSEELTRLKLTLEHQLFSDKGRIEEVSVWYTKSLAHQPCPFNEM